MEAILDGKNINYLADFYSEVERKLTKNLGWSIGRNLNAFVDVLRAGLGCTNMANRYKSYGSTMSLWNRRGVGTRP